MRRLVKEKRKAVVSCYKSAVAVLCSACGQVMPEGK